MNALAAPINRAEYCSLALISFGGKIHISNLYSSGEPPANGRTQG
jgi:hypothetical protein